MSIYQAGTTLNQLSATDWQAIPGTTYSATKQDGNRVTTSTYQSQSQQVVTGNYDKVSSLNGNYITDVTLQPYIRSQSVIVRASGMKVNTPVSVYFDGMNVNEYMVSPNVLVVSGVPTNYGKGGFEAGDVVGYMSGSTFIPTARVISVSTITTVGTVKVQMLYVTNDANTTTYSSTNILQNAVFDSNGNYVSNTTFGTYSSGSTSQISLSGTIQGTPTGGTLSTLPGGAAYYTSATSIQLAPNASSTNNYYNGSTIRIKTTTQVAKTTRGKVGQQWVGDWEWGMWLEDVIGNITVWENVTQSYQAVISAYNGSTKVATLATPVNISKGSNQTQFNVPSVKSDITSTYTLDGVTYLMTQATTSTVMPRLSTDAQGNFSGITGDRLLRVDNRTTDGDSSSATTFAKGIFTASSLATRSQSLNFGATIQAAAKSTVFTSINQQNNVLINQVSFTVDPVAQTFIIDKNTYPSGAFIKSIKVFFKSKPTQIYGSPPVKLFITDTLNGYPDGQPLDGTLVTKTCQEINVSSTPHYLNASTYTEFVFDAPVYIRPSNLYSFILQTTSPDYVIWIAAQNSIAVSSSVKALPTDQEPTSITKIGGSPYVGALFESQNGITWTADQTKQMMFTIENCVFSTIVTPTVEFIVPKKIPARKPVDGSIEYVSNQSTMTTFTSIPNSDGNFFNRDIRADAFNVTVTDFAPTNTSLSYTYRPTLYSDYSADTQKDVSPGKYATTMEDHLYMDDGKGARVINANTANSFVLTATISTSDKYVSPVLSDDGTSLYIVKNLINDMSLANTDITVTSGNTIGVTANYSSTPPAVTISAPTGPGGTQAYATANLVYNPATTGYYVDKINVTSGGSGYIETPTITIGANTGGNSATAIVSGETSPKGGNGLARYITKPVVLTPDNISGDLRVYYTAYKPVGSQVNVYYKILNGNDTGQLNDQNWTLMTNIGEKPSSFSLTRDDLREYEAAPGVFGVANNQVSYASTDGSTYTTFNQFAIKLVLQTSDTARTPIVHDLRVLALPSGV